MRATQTGFGLAKLLLLLAAIIVAAALLFRQELGRLYHVITLFEAEHIVANMRNSDAHFPTATVKAGDSPWPLPQGEQVSLPETFAYYDNTINTADYIDYTHTSSLMVVQDGQRRFEAYYRGETATDRHISFSTSKSFISALVGIAAAEGKIDIEKTADFYVPEFKGSGYEGVRIKDILQMSSGVAFNEDYGDFASDINRFGRTLALGGSFTEFAASLENEVEPGSRRLYVSIDTQVLGTILTRSTGKTIAAYMQEKLWQPMGAASDAYWIVDDKGMEMALGGLNATLADYTRFGLLYLNQGRRGAQQIVPLDWWQDSFNTDAPHLQAGTDEKSLDNWGYGYQWWIPPTSAKHSDVFMAVGIYDQYIYIDPSRKLVITKLSGNPHYTNDQYESLPKTLAMFRAIAESFDQP